MAEPVLSARGLTKSFGAVVASRDVSLEVMPGTIHAVIGPNGAGKSTLVAQICGAVRPDAGAVLLNGRDVTRLPVAARARAGLARSFQVSAVVPAFTVRQNVTLALAGRDRRTHSPFARWRADAALSREAASHADRVGLGDRMEVPADALSHGERRRLDLSMALALRPRVLVLDEPMAGLGSEGTAEITAMLSDLRRDAPILLVEHDMDAVFALADRVTVLVDGAVIASGPVDAIRADPAVRRAYLGDGA